MHYARRYNDVITNYYPRIPVRTRGVMVDELPRRKIGDIDFLKAEGGIRWQRSGQARAAKEL